jgi:transposase-like protein
MMTKISYGGYRFPPEIIQQAIWLYIRFTLSFRDVEDLLAERGILVSYESVRRWETCAASPLVPSSRSIRYGRSGSVTP